jgi:hypothetical protein
MSKWLSARPIHWDHADKAGCHPDFRFDVRQEVGNPPRAMCMPVNERGAAGYEIPVKPEASSC